jgi:MerR family transcriptional regulator, light-induced transcriptional regulator
MTNSSSPPGAAGNEPALLTIREVSERTGIPVAGLRNWERRYGLPRPARSAGGQRRYRESDAALLAEVQRGRERGLSLNAAIAQATAVAGETSLFAGLSRRHPGLRVHILPKSILLALTRAIEDECCARAQRPLLVGGFQRRQFYAAAKPRWASLARTAEQTLVFADFTQVRHQAGPITEIPILPDSPVQREWALICDAPDLPACVIGWERPGQDATPDAQRIFEALWSVDPQVVRSAAVIAAGLAEAAMPARSSRLTGRLAEPAAPGSADLQRASGLLERTLDYLTEYLPAAARDATAADFGAK